MWERNCTDEAGPKKNPFGGGEGVEHPVSKVFLTSRMDMGGLKSTLCRRLGKNLEDQWKG